MPIRAVPIRRPSSPRRPSRRRLSTVLAVLATCGVLAGAAQAQVTLTGPSWQIGVSDYGYSDYLGDLTPGFEGREYLSGEWGAAIGYQRQGKTVSPLWLEPNFIYPDWQTNSNFQVVTPMTLGDLNAQGLPTAMSVIANNDLRITQKLQIVDTLTGIAMGNAAAGAGSGASLLSNRYVLTQSYTFENISGTSLSGLQFFQLLHGLNSQGGVFDNRAYGGAMADYRYDTTLGGDASQLGGAGQFDYIGFHSKIAPSAVEIGAYGRFDVDNHGLGKPSVGTHLSVEANALNGQKQYSGLPSDSSPGTWVAGAQRYELGTLAADQSVTFDLALSILTGYQVGGSGGGGTQGSAGGGSSQPGGVDFEFNGSVDAGKFFFSFEREDAQGVSALIAAGQIGTLSFQLPGDHLPLWELEYDASFSGLLTLHFGLTGLVPAGIDPSRLHVYHWKDGSWVDLGGVYDAARNTLTVTTDSLSPFAVGLPVPEPASAALLLLGLGVLVARARRRDGLAG